VEAHKIAGAHNHKHKKIDWFIFLCIYLWTNQFPYAYGYASMQFYVLPPIKLLVTACINMALKPGAHKKTYSKLKT